MTSGSPTTLVTVRLARSHSPGEARAAFGQRLHQACLTALGAGHRLRSVELREALREALEIQVLEHEPAQAALVLREAVGELGAVVVADGLLDAGAVALRRRVAETDEALLLDELIERLTLDGAVPSDSGDLLRQFLMMAAATAGGLRPTVRELTDQLGAERALSGAWLATLAAIRVVALSLERTEADVVDEILGILDPT